MKTFNITFPFQVKFHPSPISPRAFISSVEPYACANTIATILFRHPLNWVIRSHKASRAWNARNKRSLHVSRTQIALWILQRERERNDPFGMGNRYLHDPWNVTRPHRRYYESERRGFEFRGMDFRILYERNIVGESVRCGGGASCVRRGGGAISRKFWLDSSLNVGEERNDGTKGFGNVRFISWPEFRSPMIDSGIDSRISPVALSRFEYLSCRRWKLKMKMY